MRATVIQAHLFWSIRRNRVVTVTMGVAGLLFLMGVHYFMREMVSGNVIAAAPQDVAKLATRNLIPIYALMTMVGLHVVASDRRSGTLGWRVTLLGDAVSAFRSIWVFGGIVCGVAAVALTLFSGLFGRLVWRSAGIGTVPDLALDTLLVFGALLTFFAWGVLISSLVSETWAQIVFGFMVPWIALPILRASMVATAPHTWLEIRRLVPFEAALSLSAWVGHPNPLIDEGGSLPIHQVVSCAALVGVSVYLCKHRLRSGRIDA